MWPMRHEMTRDECRKCLRCLELDAYGSMVSVLRAQGPFTNEKQKLLQELAKVLHISNERHRAEIRRAVNDEKLATIAEQLNGPNTGTDWTIEGRRAIPLLPRLKAQSAFTTLADSLSLATAVANRRNFRVHEKTEIAKDVRNEPPVYVKIQEKILSNSELSPKEDTLDSIDVLTEVTESDKSEDSNNQSNNCDNYDKNIISEKRKPSSSLSVALPNKVLVMSSNSLETSKHGTIGKESHENTVELAPLVNNTLQSQNITIIPLNINCEESVTDIMESVSQESCSNQSLVPYDGFLNAIIPTGTISSTKTKTKVIATQNNVNRKVGSAVLVSNNVSGINLKSDDHATLAQDSLDSKMSPASHNVQKTSNRENANLITGNLKCGVPLVHSNVKSAITKPISASNSNRLIAIPPNTTASNGPGPPIQQTTLACKKLPTVLSNQATAKMGVTLNSNKTVNISHHPNTKIASKTNVIVIQKGQTKGVTFSHTGKEVLGKVIMGGKNFCVTNQQNTPVNLLPRHITLNNGDQAITMISTTNSSYTESISSNLKSGNTIKFSLRQDVLEKNKVLSNLLDSTNVLTSEPTTVIQNTNARFSKEASNSGLNVQEKELIINPDTVISSVKDKKQSCRRARTNN